MAMYNFSLKFWVEEYFPLFFSLFNKSYLIIYEGLRLTKIHRMGLNEIYILTLSFLLYKSTVHRCCISLVKKSSTTNMMLWYELLINGFSANEFSVDRLFNLYSKFSIIFRKHFNYFFFVTVKSIVWIRKNNTNNIAGSLV